MNRHALDTFITPLKKQLRKQSKGFVVRLHKQKRFALTILSQVSGMDVQGGKKIFADYLSPQNDEHSSANPAELRQVSVVSRDDVRFPATFNLCT